MNRFNEKFKNKTLNQLIARQMLSKFSLEEMNSLYSKSPELTIAIDYWLNNL